MTAARRRTPATAGTIRIRPANDRDVPAITEIYNAAVRTTTATFDLDPRRLSDRRRWFRAHGPRHPVFVAVRGSRVVGWTALGPWSDRAAYAATGEVSTYVAEGERGRGTGSRLLATLVRRGRRTGHHTLLARVTDGNAASLRMHVAAGFVPVGVMREVGMKFGRRLDVHLLQLVYPSAPAGRRVGPSGRRRLGRN